MNARHVRFLAAATCLALGATLVWLSAAVPVAAGTAPGSSLNSGEEGLSSFTDGLRERSLLAPSVSITSGPEGLGLSPLPWDRWALRPQDAVLSARSDLALRPGELRVAQAWLQAGGHLVVLAESEAELDLASQLLGDKVPSAPVFDGAFDGTPSRIILPDADHLYQLDAAIRIAGPQSILPSPGLSWIVSARPNDAAALAPNAFVARFPVGRGWILVVGDSHPFSNAGLGERDNRFLADWLADELASGGGVVFVDEGHRSQGGTIRLDVALRSLGPVGRAALVGLAVVAAAVLVGGVVPRLRRLLESLARPKRAPPAAAPGLEDAKRKHPDWDARVLARLWGGPPT